MNQILSKRWTILLLILIPLLVSLACATLTGDTLPDSRESDEFVVQADVVFGPGTFDLLDTTAGLSNLPSYRATLRLSFDGTRDGQPSEWSKTYVMLTTNEPVTRLLTLEKTGDISDLDELIMAEADGAAYEKRGENGCNANVIEEVNSLSVQLEPANFLTGLIGAEEMGAETINDTAANHYRFDERAFGQLGLAQSIGEMWIASDGGYILKYLLTTSGDADYFGEGIEGTLSWDYELTDVNGPLTFALPDDCPAGMVNAPLLPDASDILSVPSMLAYGTASSPADAAAFYQEQVPSLGWKLLGEPTISDTTVTLTYEQGDQQMTIIIMANADVTTVNILLDKAQEETSN